MNEKFNSLDIEKRQRIINAAMKEFAQKGYQQASTNEIVKEAAISKGLLFHYFTNKKKLYLYLFDYSVETMMEEFFGKMERLDPDIFERFIQITVYKLSLFKQYPGMFDFLLKAIQDEEIKSELESKEVIEKAYQKIYEGIDYSKFKEELDLQKGIEIIQWTFEGFAEKEQQRLMDIRIEDYDINEITVNMRKYIKILKEALYRS